MIYSTVAVELDDIATSLEFLAETYWAIEQAIENQNENDPVSHEALQCPNLWLCSYTDQIKEIVKKLFEESRKEKSNGNHEETV